ncbi:MAG: NUDIX hydrolase [Methanomassiliicoccales archaeon]|nr:NUDIX hydrolase [Methanomassiliicoccales archaeon]
MAKSMGYGLRAEAVLTRGGFDVADQTAYRTLRSVGLHGIEGAAEELCVSPSTVRRRLRDLGRRLNGQVFRNGELTSLGQEILEQMERHSRLLQEQMEHLWKKPTLTCDGLVRRGKEVLLVRRGRDPFKGRYALPGGIVEYGESTEECVVREVMEETGLRTRVIRLLGVLSSPDRDPRGHFVTLIYELEVLGGEVVDSDDAESAGFFPLDDLPPLAFDHSLLIKKAVDLSPEDDL